MCLGAGVLCSEMHIDMVPVQRQHRHMSLLGDLYYQERGSRDIRGIDWVLIVLRSLLLLTISGPTTVKVLAHVELSCHTNGAQRRSSNSRSGVAQIRPSTKFAVVSEQTLLARPPKQVAHENMTADPSEV